jgi:acyl-CoA thioesterase-1
MQAPPNLGRPYAERFRAIYPDLARKNDVALVPFLLDGVAGVPSLNQPDGVHPTAAGQERLAENVWPALRGLLAAGGKGP